MFDLKSYAVLMADYSAWQNDNLVTAANGLSEEARQEDRGAFFGSIAHTFSHILLSDHGWMSRFTGKPAPEGKFPGRDFFGDWEAFCEERARFDQVIRDWAQALDPSDYDGEFSWVPKGTETEITVPQNALVVHFFNHGTHHRGQIHAMLTDAGAKPGVTDIPFLPQFVGNA